MIINGILAGTGRSLGKAGGSNLPIKILTKEEYETMDKQEGDIYLVSAGGTLNSIIKVSTDEYNSLQNLEEGKLYVVSDDDALTSSDFMELFNEQFLEYDFESEGNIQNNKGIVSGFSNENYIMSRYIRFMEDEELYLGIIPGEESSTREYIFFSYRGLSISILNSKLCLKIGDRITESEITEESTIKLNQNTPYQIRLKCSTDFGETGPVMTITLEHTDDSSWNNVYTDVQVQYSGWLMGDMYSYIGGTDRDPEGNSYFRGSIDLNKSCFMETGMDGEKRIRWQPVKISDINGKVNEMYKNIDFIRDGYSQFNDLRTEISVLNDITQNMSEPYIYTIGNPSVTPTIIRGFSENDYAYLPVSLINNRCLLLCFTHYNILEKMYLISCEKFDIYTENNEISIELKTDEGNEKYSTPINAWIDAIRLSVVYYYHPWISLEIGSVSFGTFDSRGLVIYNKSFESYTDLTIYLGHSNVEPEAYWKGSIKLEDSFIYLTSLTDNNAENPGWRIKEGSLSWDNTRLIDVYSIQSAATDAKNAATDAQNAANIAQNIATDAQNNAIIALSAANDAQNNANYALSAANDALSQLENKVSKDELNSLITFDNLPNLSIVGTPSISGGVMSNFSPNDYAMFPFLVELRQPFEINFKITTGSDVTTQQNILDSEYGLAFAIKDNDFVIAWSSNGTSWNLGVYNYYHNVEPNTVYYIKISYDARYYWLNVYDSNNIQLLGPGLSAEGNLLYPRPIYVGHGAFDENNYFQGSIDLNTASLTINGNVVWRGMDLAGFQTKLSTDMSNLVQAGKDNLVEIVESADKFATKSELEEIKTLLGEINTRLENL